MEEWTGDPRAPEVTHYGWEYTDKTNVVAMIYPRAVNSRMNPWMRLELCFTYGMQAEIDRGRGKMRALRITARDPTSHEDDPRSAS